jgi:hypothetical protein
LTGSITAMLLYIAPSVPPTFPWMASQAASPIRTFDYG